jgi:hypothetical protein
MSNLQVSRANVLITQSISAILLDLRRVDVDLAPGNGKQQVVGRNGGADADEGGFGLENFQRLARG